MVRDPWIFRTGYFLGLKKYFLLLALVRNKHTRQEMWNLQSWHLALCHVDLILVEEYESLLRILGVAGWRIVYFYQHAFKLSALEQEILKFYTLVHVTHLSKS